MGLLFTPKLFWTSAKENLVDKANTAVITIKIIQNKLWSPPVHDSSKLFNTMIVPILCHGSEIWRFELAKQIEVVQDRFCKIRYENPQKLTQLSPSLIQDISWEKGQHKRRHQRQHQRQPGEQLFPIQVITD